MTHRCLYEWLSWLSEESKKRPLICLDPNRTRSWLSYFRLQKDEMKQYLNKINYFKPVHIIKLFFYLQVFHRRSDFAAKRPI